jgi:hypothetical protein
VRSNRNFGGVVGLESATRPVREIREARWTGRVFYVKRFPLRAQNREIRLAHISSTRNAITLRLVLCFEK